MTAFRIFHLCFMFVMNINGNIANFSPDFTLNQHDVYEGVYVRMRCEIAGAPCNPVAPYVLLEKLIDNHWEPACRVFRNDTYEPVSMSDNNTVQGRGTVDYSYATSWYDFYLDELNLKDNGNWQCALPECEDDTLKSDPVRLTINTALNRDNIIVTPPDFILLNTPNQYTCYSGRVYPEANVTWTQGGETSEGTSNNKFNQDGYYWEIENTNTFTFCDKGQMEVSCALSKTSGDIPWDVNKTVNSVDVYAPAVIENITISTMRPNISDTLTLTCKGSGTSHTISWFKDGSILEDALFERSDVIEYGVFKCGETNATLSTLTWTQNEGLTCDMVTKHDGQYLCEVGAEKGQPDRSDSYNIAALYPPILTYYNIHIEAHVGETITLTCQVECSMPNDLTYSWMRIETREDLHIDAPSIELIVTSCDFCNTIKCTVQNAVGTHSMTFNITEKEYELETTTPTIIEPETTPEDQSQASLGFAASFAIGLVVGILMCVAIFSGFLFHHKDKFKKMDIADKHHIYENDNVTAEEKQVQNDMLDFENIDQEKAVEYEQLTFERQQCLEMKHYERMDSNTVK